MGRGLEGTLCQQTVEVIGPESQMPYRLFIGLVLAEFQREERSFSVTTPFSKASVAQARATPALMTSRPICSTTSMMSKTAKQSVTPSMEPVAKMGSWS